jgi:hypothetical protein
MELVPTESENSNGEFESEEQKHQEPVDQISLSSIDNIIEPNDDYNTTETTV